MTDGVEDISSIKEELRVKLTQDLQVVSYKWLAREYQVNANLAKRVLASIADSLKEQVAATYLISGWTKDTKQHVVKVVQGSSVQGVCQQLEPITSKHIYSLCPGPPKDTAALSQQDYLQSVELMKAALEGKPNASMPCFKSNLCSAVAFTPPHKPEPRFKEAPKKVEQEPQKLQRPSGPSDTKRGKEPSSGKPSIFSPSSGKASWTGAPTTAAAAKETAEASEADAGALKVHHTATAASPAKPSAKTSPTKSQAAEPRGKAPASGKAGSMSLAQAWSKAPSAKKGEGSKQQAAKPGGKGEQQVAGSNKKEEKQQAGPSKAEEPKHDASKNGEQPQQQQEEEEDDLGPRVQRGRKRSNAVHINDSDEEDDVQTAQPPAKKQQEQQQQQQPETELPTCKSGERPPAETPKAAGKAEPKATDKPKASAKKPTGAAERAGVKAADNKPEVSAGKAGAKVEKEQQGAEAKSTGKGAKRGRAQSEEEANADEVEGVTEKPSGKGSNKGAGQKSKEAAKSSASAMKGKHAPAPKKQTAKKAKEEQQEEEQEREEEEAAQGTGSAAEAAQGEQPQRQHQQSQGPRMKRVKRMETYIDDKGQDVTHEVTVEVEMTEAEVAAEAAQSSSRGAGTSSKTAAAGGEAGGGKQGGGAKAGEASSNKASGSGTKGTGKGKAPAPANQKDIMSFFNKKQ